MMRPSSSGSGPFPTTVWDRVRAAADDPQSLQGLLAVYRGPLIEHLHRVKHFSLDDAEDLVHEFVAKRLLSAVNKAGGDGESSSTGFFDRADEKKGRFRAYLLTALHHFCIDEVRRSASLKEKPNRARGLPEIDMAAWSEDQVDAVFDVALGLKLLQLAIRRLEQICREKGRVDHWLLFEGRVLALLCGSEPITYVELASRLGFDTEKQAANAFQTVQNRFRRCWAEVLAEHLGADPADEADGIVASLRQAGPDLLDALRMHLWGELPAITQLGGRPHLSPAALDLLLPGSVPPDDLAAVMRHVLTAPVWFETGDLAPALVARLPRIADQSDGWVTSFLDLFRHPNPGIDLLVLVKEFAKENRADPDSALPPEVATVLYYATIATAFVRHRQSITEHDPATLRKGLEWVGAQPWVGDEVRGLAAAAVAAVGR